MTINFDPENTALLPGVNLIEASAGTGKTYTIAMLVLRFVVEKKLDIKKILVVTFTKVATEELKNRIRSRLVEARLAVINLNNEELNTELYPDKIDIKIKQWLNSLDIEPDLILQRLHNALLDIDQSVIFTIHGFCQRILAEHALESGQLFDTKLTSDISEIKQTISDDFWRKNIYQRSAWETSLLTAHYPTPDKLLASVDFITADLTVFPDYEDLDQKLIELKQLCNKNNSAIKTSLSFLQKTLVEGKFKVNFEGEFETVNQSILDWLNNNSLTIPDFSLFTKQGLLNALNGNKFRKSNANPLSSDEQKQTYIDSLNFDSAPFEQLNSSINKLSIVFRRALLKTLHEKVSNKLQELNIVSFDDLITRLVDALAGIKGQSLREDIQQQYQVALIDEFQDTDQSQWYIFSTLFKSKEHSLYLIGDPKQAIYKFRGADIQSYFTAKTHAAHQFSLGFNWRSCPQLVEAINVFFSIKNPFFSEKLNFNPIKPAMAPEEGGLVKQGRPLPPLVLWQLDKSDKEIWTAGKAANEIKIAVVNEILDLLLPVFSLQKNSHGNNVHPRDIAILVRTNPQAKDFQQALNEAGVTAVINSKESVFSSAEASDLYFLLLAIAEPTNILFIKQALTLPWFDLNGQQLLRVLNDEFVLDSWFSRFQNYNLLWKNKGLMVMIVQFLSVERVSPHLSKNILAERCLTNLEHCIELVQQAVVDEHLGINKTLAWLHKNITKASSGSISSDEDQQLRLESDEDSVKIITMHSAKGLEYPIVFCPFLWQRSDRLNKEKLLIKCHKNSKMIADLGSDNYEDHRKIALDEELAEDLRIFYVAITRAKYRCYINWADVRTKDKPNNSAMAYLLNFYADDFLLQQEKLTQYSLDYPLAFEYRLLNSEEEITRHWKSQVVNNKLSYKQRQRSLYTHWQMSSYTALSSLSINETPELPDDKARENTISKELEQDDLELPRGAKTGNVIHDLLENNSFKLLAEDGDISLQRDKSCLRYGLKCNDPDQIDQLLYRTVKTELTSENDSFCLKDLTDQQCLKEMPFYLSMKQMDVSQINHILKGDPTFQSLSTKTLCGYLTGFIDLICEYNGRYYVIDYKSNGLSSYNQDSLTTSMREHNYGLQYWIYTLVLHQYLKKRLSGYCYEQHFGGVMYLFVRGMGGENKNNGIYQVKPELVKIEQLANLFILKS
ncbi:MAG: exodeoxyribonuclease V subunit beta [Methylococcaceae bacterium]|nr:exodeoxyribonuclease V subunit beta [Methylococcaceae bacterium]